MRKQPPLLGAIEAQDRRHDAGLPVRMRAQCHVLDHRQFGNQAHMLERACNAAACDRLRREALDRLTIEQDAPRRCAPHPGHQIKECALAGAVGPDQRHRFGLADGETHVVDRNQAAEGFACLVEREQRARGSARRSHRNLHVGRGINLARGARR